jgi:hypothetical protein
VRQSIISESARLESSPLCSSSGVGAVAVAAAGMPALNAAAASQQLIRAESRAAPVLEPASIVQRQQGVGGIPLVGERACDYGRNGSGCLPQNAPPGTASRASRFSPVFSASHRAKVTTAEVSSRPGSRKATTGTSVYASAATTVPGDIADARQRTASRCSCTYADYISAVLIITNVRAIQLAVGGLDADLCKLASGLGGDPVDHVLPVGAVGEIGSLAVAVVVERGDAGDGV